MLNPNRIQIEARQARFGTRGLVLAGLVLVLTIPAFAAIPAAATVSAQAEATASRLRFAVGDDGPWQDDSAVFEGAGVDTIVIAYDYEEATGESYELSVIAPGGLPVHASRESLTGSGTATARIDGAGIYRDLTADLHETLRSSRVDADRLTNATVGLTEYILQLQANATRASSAMELLELIDLSGDQAAQRSAVDEMVEDFAALTAEARATDPSDVERIQALAGQMAQRIGSDLPKAKALETHAAGVSSMPIPATDRGADQPYDVLVAIDDFAAVSGEFRVYPPITIFLPRLSQNEATR